MKNLTPKKIADAVGGTLIGGNAARNTAVRDSESLMDETAARASEAPAFEDTEVTAVTSDSRNVTEGCLFIPIKGERVDGHTFITDVMKKGALVTLTEQPDAAGTYPHILVPSTTEAIKDLARFYLNGLETPVVSVAGSVGKTSTKEAIASVLSEKFRTLKTLGNFNNDLGLPLTIFRLTEEDEVCVLEMGISHFGEMDVLSSIAPPDVSVITNIGTCHLEFLGDRDGVFKAKTEVFHHLKKGGRVVLNGDDDKLNQVKEVNGQKPVFFGLDPKNDFWADHIEELGLQGISCTLHMEGRTLPVTIPIPGLHMVMNALAAAAVGTLFHETDDEIRAGIENLQTLGGRFKILDVDGIRVIDDCYNANPMSMKASLSVLKDAAGRKVALLGDMGELGVNERTLHREVGVYAATLPLDLVVTAGPLASLIAGEIKTHNPAMAVETCADTDALIKNLPNFIKKGDTVLVKASHFMHFEKLVNVLTKKNVADI